MLDQDSSFYQISFSILITYLLNNVWILQGEGSCQSRLGVYGLNSISFSLFTSPRIFFMTPDEHVEIIFVNCGLRNEYENDLRSNETP